MTFEEKLKLNREAYMSAKKGYKNLNIEVATRNNIKNIVVTKYDATPPNKAIQLREKHR